MVHGCSTWLIQYMASPGTCIFLDMNSTLVVFLQIIELPVHAHFSLKTNFTHVNYNVQYKQHVDKHVRTCIGIPTCTVFIKVSFIL